MTGAQAWPAQIAVGDLVAGTAPFGDESSTGPNEGWVTGYLVLPSTPPNQSLTTALPGRTPASLQMGPRSPATGSAK